jgi:hypothetical protein
MAKADLSRWNPKGESGGKKGKPVIGLSAGLPDNCGTPIAH